MRVLEAARVDSHWTILALTEGSAFAPAAVGVQPIGTAATSPIFKTCRRKERE